ncbi:MAG: hydantoinase B/oxoprolinase family protein, partial [Maritimibacter sp.]|nr:hydantoinase B/oxoprolinase family protein [Maritimibacter sp.]
TGGPGRWRGGNGVVRSYRLLDDAGGALWFERSKTPAWGLLGGQAAEGPSNTLVLPDGTEETPLKMRARALPKGTLVVTRTGGGGGYGDPLARPFGEIQKDLDRGWISAAAAERDYGVVVTDGRIDEAASTPRAAL